LFYSASTVYDNQGNLVDIKKQNECPFCRAEVEETSGGRRSFAIFSSGCYYYHGSNGFIQDYIKALELYHHAAELRYSDTYTNIGYA